jgi:hypothetical protein
MASHLGKTLLVLEGKREARSHLPMRRSASEQVPKQLRCHYCQE